MPVTALRLVAYIMHPPWAKWLQRVLLVLSYSLIVMTGLRSYNLHEGVLLDLSGWVMVGGGLGATFGALGRLYNIESIGLWVAIAGLAGGCLWAIGDGAWYVAYAVGAISALLGLRLQTLSRIAHALKTEHRLKQGGP